MPVARCSKCNDTKPLSQFWGNGRGGASTYCKPCGLLHRQAWSHRKGIHTPAKRRPACTLRTAYCMHCKQWLVFSCFYPNKNRKDGLHLYCKSCDSKRQKARKR